MKLFRRKSRKYPIKRDEYGRSKRQQAFSYFKKGYRPAQIHKEELIQLSEKTLFRYFEDWKKERPQIPYSILKNHVTRDPEINERTIAKLSKALEIKKEEVVKRMQRPWGLMQLIKGQWPNNKVARIRSENENRLDTALRLSLLFKEVNDKKPAEVGNIIQRFIIEIKKEYDEQGSQGWSGSKKESSCSVRKIKQKGGNRWSGNLTHLSRLSTSYAKLRSC